MKINFNIVILVSFIFIISCKNQYYEVDEIGIYDISRDGSEVIFSYIKNETSSIYSIKIDGSNLKKIIGTTQDVNYYNPRFSPDNSKIVFISNHKNNINSTLCIADADGKNIIQLSDAKQIITEANFANDGESILFCKANVYENYSPIGKKDAHDFDIYSINLRDNKITQITNIKAYGMNNISVIDNNSFLLRIENGPYGGIFLYTQNSTSKLQKIVPANNPRNDPSFYYTPVYSDTLKMIGFTAPYELYVMNIEDKQAQLVNSNIGSYNFGNICFFKNQPSILFSYEGGSDLYSINVDGTDLMKIPIFIK